MEDGDKNKNVEEDLPRKSFSNLSNVCTILQSFWVRYCTILPNIIDRKFMESELRIVLYCGTIFWTLYLFSKII